MGSSEKDQDRLRKLTDDILSNEEADPIEASSDEYETDS